MREHLREKNTFKKANLTCIQGKKMIRYSYINVNRILSVRSAHF